MCMTWSKEMSLKFLKLEVSATHNITGRKIAPNTGTKATKFFTLATKS